MIFTVFLRAKIDRLYRQHISGGWICLERRCRERMLNHCEEEKKVRLTSDFTPPRHDLIINFNRINQQPTSSIKGRLREIGTKCCNWSVPRHGWKWLRVLLDWFFHQALFANGEVTQCDRALCMLFTVIVMQFYFKCQVSSPWRGWITTKASCYIRSFLTVGIPQLEKFPWVTYTRHIL